jgi:MFS transporter, SP family, general alpha glucoside:H+ symporter
MPLWRLTANTASAGSALPETANHDNLPLRAAVRQYSRLVGYTFAIMSSVLLWGYDSAVVGNISALPAFQMDFGEWNDADQEWQMPALWLGLWSAFGPLGQAVGALCTGWLQDRWGRRPNLLMGSIITAVGATILFFSNRPPSVDGKRGMFLAGKLVRVFSSSFEYA